MRELRLAIIVPCYNEEEIFENSYEELSNVLNNLIALNKISADSYIVFVDDGSTDNTWAKISATSAKGIKLSRNFGHQFALLAGLLENDADIYITIDADLQDDTSIIEQMVDQYNEGNEIVYGVRNNRDTDTFLKKFFANIYYKLCSIIGMKTIPQHADFRLISKKIVQLLRNNQETNLYLRGLIPSYGFKTTSLFYKRKKRIAGETKYTYMKSINLAIDGITSFTAVPLRFIVLLSVICFLFAGIMTLYALYSYLTSKTVAGWPSLFISLYFIGGVQLLSIGILGEYIAKIYNETKHRQLYIIEELHNDKTM